MKRFFITLLVLSSISSFGVAQTITILNSDNETSVTSEDQVWVGGGLPTDEDDSYDEDVSTTTGTLSSSCDSYAVAGLNPFYDGFSSSDATAITVTGPSKISASTHHETKAEVEAVTPFSMKTKGLTTGNAIAEGDIHVNVTSLVKADVTVHADIFNVLAPGGGAPLVYGIVWQSGYISIEWVGGQYVRATWSSFDFEWEVKSRVKTSGGVLGAEQTTIVSGYELEETFTMYNVQTSGGDSAFEVQSGWDDTNDYTVRTSTSDSGGNYPERWEISAMKGTMELSATAL